MMLEIIVTHWNEPWDLVQKGFMMLSLQRGVDWNKIKVTLIHDGTVYWPEEYFEFCPFRVHQVSIEHRGIAGVRNWAIDHSTAEWIKFNDCDDMFSGLYSLKTIMDALAHARKFDMLWFDFYGEMTDGRVVIRNERDPVLLHGKLLRRSFLADHEIRFQEDLIWCEDSAFLAVVEMEIDHQKIGKIKGEPLYAYIAREGSLCNRPEILFQNLCSFFRRHCYVAEEFRKRGLTDQFNTMCVRVMCDSYYSLCRAPGITEDKTQLETDVWNWFAEHRQAFEACRPEMFDMVIEAVNRERTDGGWIDKQDVLNWIQKHERTAA